MANDRVNSKNRSVRILIVDDNPGDILLLKRALRRLTINHETHTASTGEEVLDLLQETYQKRPQELPDLIFLDLNLPKISGLEVLKVIKSDVHFRAIPVFILSSSSAKQDVLACYQAHANCYLVKSYFEEFDALVPCLEQFWFVHVLLPNHSG